MNYLNDDSVSQFFKEAILPGKTSLRNLYLNQNNLTTHKALELHSLLKQAEKTHKFKLYVDKFEKIQFYTEDRLKNTIFFERIDSTSINDKNRMLSTLHPRNVGLIKMPIRIRQGKKLPSKNGPNNYVFVEFELPKMGDQVGNGVTKMVNKGRIRLGEKAYLAGTNTFVYYRRSKRK